MDLEQTIRDLIRRKYACAKDSAERRFYERLLTGLRYSCEEAGGIMESLDPREWGGPCRPL
jgi:hypothetical protein